ncbi:MAG: hypothetical protein CMP23_04790 [Rickettsiales bacterium]|nr:hypothetical protein [Rickettsiales bacterium]
MGISGSSDGDQKKRSDHKHLRFIASFLGLIDWFLWDRSRSISGLVRALLKGVFGVPEFLALRGQIFRLDRLRAELESPLMVVIALHSTIMTASIGSAGVVAGWTTM